MITSESWIVGIEIRRAKGRHVATTGTVVSGSFPESRVFSTLSLASHGFPCFSTEHPGYYPSAPASAVRWRELGVEGAHRGKPYCDSAMYGYGNT
jgi:hypothetical protein